jgi:hypothetical protein
VPGPAHRPDRDRRHAGGGAVPPGRRGAHRPAGVAGEQLHLRAADDAGAVPGGKEVGVGVKFR